MNKEFGKGLGDLHSRRELGSPHIFKLLIQTKYFPITPQFIYFCAESLRRCLHNCGSQRSGENPKNRNFTSTFTQRYQMPSEKRTGAVPHAKEGYEINKLWRNLNILPVPGSTRMRLHLHKKHKNLKRTMIAHNLVMMRVRMIVGSRMKM